MPAPRPEALVALAFFALGAAPAPAPAADYDADVKPLLAKYCVSCHGPDKQRGGLRLDTRSAIAQGGNSGPAVVAGKAGDSLLVHALAGTNDAPRMPPKEPRPSAAEVATLKAWINAGTAGPAAETARTAAAAAKPQHWSFRPVARPPLPAVKNAPWVRNGIDAFIAARLEKEGLAPSPPADKATLIRRMSLDLTGLPPTPAEVDAFLADARPDAAERLADRLLASPHYGERWGRHWLDLARYADSNGYSIDGPRSIWPYRDWVIAALNRDLPFDRFTVEQIAGDLLPNATTDQKVATGFHRNTQINQEGGVDPEQFRVEAVADRVNTTGSVWLGLTLGCCQCHDHKYDPLSQREYYQVFAFFNSQDEPTLTVDGPNAGAVQTTRPVRGKAKASDAATTMVLKERSIPRVTKVLIGGDFTRPGVAVAPGTPATLPPLAGRGKLLADRLDLARWLTARENPLTARVFVNRVWAQYFGTGLVETENDFGTQGTPPSHPELLDWLASEFVRPSGGRGAAPWSLKALHKLVVTSATYRQSSNARPELAADPRNRLMARQSRLRLEAEVVRDVALAASGLLDPKVGGPSVFPPQPDGVGRTTQVPRAWAPSEGPDRYRRGLYTHFWRATPHPALTAFDAPDAGTACTRRNRSNTPLQALTLLNDPGFYEYAHGLALRLSKEAAGADAGVVVPAFRLCVGRPPTGAERERLRAFLLKQRAYFAAHPAESSKLLSGGGPAGKALSAAASPPPADKATLVQLARVLLNLDEFITRE